MNSGGLVVAGLLQAIAGAILLPLAKRLSDMAIFVILLLAVCVTTAGLSFTPAFPLNAVAYVWIAVAGFYFFRVRAAALVTAIIGIQYGLLVALQQGNTGAAERWGSVMATVVITGWFTKQLVEQADSMTALADAERADAETARTELAAVNASLERRVVEQVAALERVSRLRRFLPAQVADTILKSGDESIFEPHRRRIAVVFCDLRGYTAFAASVEPEDVVEVIGQYHATIGAVMMAFDATVGAFAGDGMMAYFNDPLECANPAERAVKMAWAFGPPMREQTVAWEGRGFEISYGVGIALGVATLGVVGFEGRYDYTPLGTVVNLASRLCSGAGAGEILIDQYVEAGTRDLVRTEPVGNLTLKGFAGIKAFRIVGRAGSRQILPRDMPVTEAM